MAKYCIVGYDKEKDLHEIVGEIEQTEEEALKTFIMIAELKGKFNAKLFKRIHVDVETKVNIVEE